MICLEIVILFIYLFTYLVTFLALLVDCRVTVLQNKLLVIGMYKTPTLHSFYHRNMFEKLTFRALAFLHCQFFKFFKVVKEP